MRICIGVVVARASLLVALIGCSQGAGASEAGDPAGSESASGDDVAQADATEAAGSAESQRFENPTQRCRIEPDYNRCIVDQLDGRAETEGEMIALIQSQRILGDLDGASQNMELFIERYPDSPQSATYRDFLASE